MVRIAIPKDTNVVVFTDNSGSMRSHSDTVANTTEDMRRVATAKGSTFTVVEGYNHGSGDERLVQTALKFIKEGKFEDNNGTSVSAPKNTKPTQIISQTDANLDPTSMEDMQELINECKAKNIDLVIQNPSTGAKISLNSLISKVCKPDTHEIDPDKFNSFMGVSTSSYPVPARFKSSGSTVTATKQIQAAQSYISRFADQDVNIELSIIKAVL